MNIIVAVDENWGIGYKGNLLERISEDMKFFKEKTINKIVVMGRVTFESLPNKKPLPMRENIVLSKNKEYFNQEIEIVNGIDELFEKIKNLDTENIFIIGGEKIYKMLYEYCSKAYVTKIYNKYESDAKMENLDEKPNWEIIEKSEIKQNKNGISFQFITYKNNRVKS